MKSSLLAATLMLAFANFASADVGCESLLLSIQSGSAEGSVVVQVTASEATQAQLGGGIPQELVNKCIQDQFCSENQDAKAKSVCENITGSQVRTDFVKDANFQTMLDAATVRNDNYKTRANNP